MSEANGEHKMENTSTFVPTKVKANAPTVAPTCPMPQRPNDERITKSEWINTNNISNIAVYPNPANDYINIENAENSNVTIINMVGQVVAQEVVNTAKATINTNQLSEGSYIIRVENGTEITTQKINIVR